jgi:hypothetical protein
MKSEADSMMLQGWWDLAKCMEGDCHLGGKSSIERGSKSWREGAGMENVLEYRNVIREREVQERTTSAGLVIIGMCVEDLDSASVELQYTHDHYVRSGRMNHSRSSPAGVDVGK